MKQGKKILGVVFGSECIYVAQAGGEKKCAAFDLPKDCTAEQLPKLGQQFAKFIKSNGFKANKAIAAVNSKNVMTFNLNIAAISDNSLIAKAVGIEIERKLEFDAEQIIFDFTSQTLESRLNILAAVTLKKHTNPILELLKAAKLTCELLTITPAALKDKSSPDISVTVIDDSIQTALYKEGKIALFKHLPLSSLDNGALSRSIVQMAFSAGKSTDGLSCSVYAKPDISAQITKELSDIKIKAFEVRLENSSPQDPFECNIAAQLACDVINSNEPDLNFLSKRSSPQKTSKSKPFIKAASIIMIIAIAAGLFFYSLQAQNRKLSDINAELEAASSSYQQVSVLLEKINQTRKWFNSQPVYLEIINELTASFPDEGSIWLTSFGADESMNNVITGNALEERAVLDVLDKLKSNPVFKDTRILYIRKTGQASSTVTFALNFKYMPEK